MDRNRNVTPTLHFSNCNYFTYFITARHAVVAVTLESPVFQYADYFYLHIFYLVMTTLMHLLIVQSVPEISVCFEALCLL